MFFTKCLQDFTGHGIDRTTKFQRLRLEPHQDRFRSAGETGARRGVGSQSKRRILGQACQTCLDNFRVRAFAFQRGRSATWLGNVGDEYIHVVSQMLGFDDDFVATDRYDNDIAVSQIGSFTRHAETLGGCRVRNTVR